MFRRLRRALVKVGKLTRSGKLIAATGVIQKLVVPVTKPARKKRATSAKPRKPATASATPRKAAAPKPPVPRAALGETLRQIAANADAAKTPAKTLPKPAVARGASFKLARFSSDLGARSYKLYIPAATKAQPRGTALPLVVMLHGCSQTPDDFALGTGMNRLAEVFGVIVAYPAQPVSANANRCWNWFRRSDQVRGAGEPALIAGIVRKILREHAVDPARIYIAGISAGGAAAEVAATCYPEIFAAVGIHSGLPVGAAQDPVSAFMAMRQGASGSRLAVAVPTVIFHGDADTVVHPRNGRSIAARTLAALPRLKRTLRTGRVPGGRAYSQTAYHSENGTTYCEYWTVHGAGHAWAGGHAAASYSDPSGPDAAHEMLRFFLQHRLPRHANMPA